VATIRFVGSAAEALHPENTRAAVNPIVTDARERNRLGRCFRPHRRPVALSFIGPGVARTRSVTESRRWMATRAQYRQAFARVSNRLSRAV
jgi:hypothetical protein